jgi:hypothetical protein
MPTNIKHLARWVSIGSFGIAMLIGGELHGRSQHEGRRQAAASPPLAASLFDDDGGVQVRACTPLGCPFPEHAVTLDEGASDTTTFILDEGGSVTLDRKPLASACNGPDTQCVFEYGQRYILLTGQNMGRAERAIRRGEVPILRGCQIERPEEADAGDCGYVVESVKLISQAGYKFDPKTAKFTLVDDEAAN